MPPGRIKFHQIGENQPLPDHIQRGDSLIHAIHVVLRMHCFRDSHTVKDIFNLAHSIHGLACFLNPSQQVVRLRFPGKVPPVGNSHKRIPFLHKGTGNNPGYIVISDQNFPGDTALPVQLF